MNGDPGFWHNFLSAIAYAALGITIFLGGLLLWDKLTPRYDILRVIYAEKNLAMAVLVGSFAIAIAIILAAAIHG